MSEPITDIHLRFPWGQTIEFPPHRPLAHGMRLSTTCPVQRVAEYFDEEVSPPFDPGVGAIGHLYAYLWSHQTRQEEEALELPVPWTHGVAHIDRVIGLGDYAGVYEIKTSSAKEPRPTPENIAQVMRYMAAADGNAPALEWIGGLPWYIVVIGKAGNESGWVRGPWEVTLDDDCPLDIPRDVFAGTDEGPQTGRQYALWDIDATDAMKELWHVEIAKKDAQQIIMDGALVGDYCACGQHRLPLPVRLDDPALALHIEGYREALAEEKREADEKKERYEKIKAMLDGAEPGRYEIGEYMVTKASNGRVTVR